MGTAEVLAEIQKSKKKSSGKKLTYTGGGTAEVLAEIQKSKKKSSGKKLTYTGGGTAALLQSIRGGKSEIFDIATLATSTISPWPYINEQEKLYGQLVRPKLPPDWISALAAPTPTLPFLIEQEKLYGQALRPKLPTYTVMRSATIVPREPSSLETLAFGLTGMMPGAGAAIAKIGGKLAARGGVLGKVGKAIAGIGKAGKAADAMPGLAGFGARTAKRAGTGAAEMAAFQQVADLPLLVNDPQMFLQTRPKHTAHAALMGAGFKTVLGAAGEAISLPARRAARKAISLPARRAARKAQIQQAGQDVHHMMPDYQPRPIPEKPGMTIERTRPMRPVERPGYIDEMRRLDEVDIKAADDAALQAYLDRMEVELGPAVQGKGIAGKAPKAGSQPAARPMPAKSEPVVGSRYTVPDVGEVTVSAVTPKTVRVKTAEGKTRVYTRDKWQGQAVVEPAPVTEPIKPAVDAKESLKRLLETEQVPITSMQPGDIFVDIGGGYAYRIDKVNKKTVRAARISRDGSIGKSELIPVDRWTSGIGTGISRKVPRTGYKVTPEQLDVLFGKEPTTKVSVPEVKPVVEPAKPTETPKVETGDIGPYEPSIPSQRQPGQLLSVRANKPLSEMTISELRQLHEHLKQKDNVFIENELRHARDPNVPSQRGNTNWYEIREDIALVEKAMRDKHTPAHATKPAPETVPVTQPEAKPVETPKASAPETAKPATPTKASAKVTRNVTGKATPAKETYKRKTPAKGTPEREAIDAEYKALEEAQSARYTKLYELTGQRERTSITSKKRESLDKQIKKLEQEIKLNNEPTRQAALKRREAELEDIIESGDAAQVLSAKLELQRKASGKDDGFYFSDAEIAQFEPIIRAEMKKQGIADKPYADKMITDVANALRFAKPENTLAKTVEHLGRRYEVKTYGEAALAEIREKYGELHGKHTRAIEAEIENASRDSIAKIDEALAGAKEAHKNRMAERQRIEEQESAEIAERSKSLQPTSKLRPRPTYWYGNEAQPGRFVTDKIMLIDTSAPGVRTRPWMQKQAINSSNYAQDKMKSSFDKAHKEATVKLTDYGYANDVAYLIGEDGAYRVVNAHRLRLVRDAVEYDSIRGSADVHGVIVFYKGKKPVALLMPLRVETAPKIDVGIVTGKGTTTKASAPKTAKPATPTKASAPEAAKPATPTKASAKVTPNVTGKAEKPRSNTGLTKTQEEYLAKELESILPKLQEEPKPTTIKVPGDGQFTVSNPEQANYLHTFVSGKPLPGMPKIKVKRTFQPTPKKSKPTHQEMVIKAADEAMQLYGHPWAAAEELRQHLDVIKANPSVHPENIEAIISDAISELEIRGHGKTYYAKNKSGSDYEYGDYIPSSIAPGLLKSKRWTDKAPVGTIAETRGAAVVRKKALESRRKALESELRSVESEISKESTVYVWPARRKGVKGRYVTKPLADDHPLKQKRNEIVQSLIEVNAEITEIKGEIAKGAAPTPKASAPEATTPVESRLASESGRVLTRGTPKSQLMIEAEEAATLYTRTRTAETARANQRARRWQEQLSERELEDIGAAVENIGNIKVKGDTAEAVKKRLSPKQRRVMAEYKAAQERSRQAINEYLKEIGDEEYIKAIEDYLPHFYINKPQQLKAFAQRWLKNSPNAKMRKFPTLKEAVEAGLTPVTQNVAILHKMWNELNWRVATNRRFVHEIMGLKTELGENAVVPASKAPAGWEIIDHPAIQRVYGRKTADGKLILHYGGVAVHPDIAPAVKMVLESPFSGKFARGIEMINAVAKKSALSFSGFHAWALTESARATLGVRKGLLLLGDKHPITGKRVLFKQPHKVGMEIMRDPDLLADPIMHGLQITTGVSDVPIGRIQKGLMAIEAKTRRIPVLRTFTNRLRRFNDFIDRKLWDEYHSGLKIYTYYDQVEWMAKKYPDVPIEKIKTDVANYLNDAYGGQEWATKFGVSIGSHHGKMALTPKVLQVIHGVLLAPDWTLSNINIAAKTLSKNPVRRAMQIRYWRNMAITLVLDTIALQQGIYHAFGDPNKGDKEWPWENEVGKQWDIDVTPLKRAMAKSLGRPEPEGRYYTHFGKQAREVVGWAVNWPKMLRVKSSPVVQMAYEQITGSQGDGFDLPFAGVDFIPSIPERTKAIVSKFIPFSLRGNNFAFTAPMTKGMTNWKANVAITKALESYAEDSMWPTIRKQPDFTKKLDALVADILDAAERNGLDSKKVMTQALAETRGKYYGKFFKALEKGDKKEMERAALAVVRLHGGIENMLRSAEARGIELTDEQKALMQKLIKEKQKGREAPPKPGRSINPSSIDNYIRGQMQNAGP